MSKIRYFYAGNNGRHKHNGVVTVAYMIDEYMPGKKIIKFGCSFCSPKDKFEKKLGRQIAEGRLNKKPITVYLHEHHKPIDIILRVLNEMKSYKIPGCPRWFSKNKKEILGVE